MRDRLQTVRTRIPDAAAVFLVGDFNNWSTAATPMHHVGQGEWEIHLSTSQRIERFCFFVWRQDQPFGHILRCESAPPVP